MTGVIQIKPALRSTRLEIALVSTSLSLIPTQPCFRAIGASGCWLLELPGRHPTTTRALATLGLKFGLIIITEIKQLGEKERALTSAHNPILDHKIKRLRCRGPKPP